MARRRLITPFVGVSACFIAVTMGACSDAAGQQPRTDGTAIAVGDPCLPRAESSQAFNDYDERTVSMEALSSPVRSGDPVCLVYHFRGRVTCPYGQGSDGRPPLGAAPCRTPEGQPVFGSENDPAKGAEVRAQCEDRRPQDTVYWTCRCANENGDASTGETFCPCPTSFTCQVVANAFGPDALPGSYCLKAGTSYDSASACRATCDPATNVCP